jgi:hypothetical protein
VSRALNRSIASVGALAVLCLLAACSCGETAKTTPCDRSVACEEGERCAAGVCVAIDCAKEQYWNAAAGACFACPAARTSQGGGVTACEPVDCPKDSYWRASTRSCTPCPAGSLSEGGTARSCSAIACEPDRVWGADARACVACDAGAWSPGGAVTACVAIDCGPDQHWSTAYRRCVPCPFGETSAGGAVRDCVPVDCAANERWDEEGRVCVPCDAGEASPGGAATACIPISCATNGYWNASARRCETCAAGATSPGGNVTSCEAERCPPETARAFDGRCVPCPSGTHSAGGAATVCDAAACAADRYWDPVHGACSPCEAGRSSGGGFPSACTPDCAPQSWAAGTVLAGDRSQPERAVDGLGRAASFADVGRLRWDRAGQRLVAFDGAVRAIGLDGMVSTLVTATDLSLCNLGEGGVDVDVAGGIAWFCAGTSSLVRREPDGRVVSFPVAWSADRVVRTLASEPSGGVLVGWSTRVCQDAGGPCWKSGFARIDRTGGVSDVLTTDARADLGGMTDLVVTGDGRAFVIDPEAGVVHVLDLATGLEQLLVDGVGAPVAPEGRRAAVDAAGRLFVGGRVIDTGGTLVATYTTTDAGDAPGLAGADDDLVRSACSGAGALRRCELVLQAAVCAP